MSGTGGYGYGYGMPAVPQPPPPAPAAQKSSLPVISLVLGILSVICGGFILGIAAIVTGVMGRKKAKAYGSGSGMALAGIITGIIGTVVTTAIIILTIAGGLKLFNTVQDQVVIADQLRSATTAAQVYAVDHNGSYEGLTTETLLQSGYIPNSTVTVKAQATAGGASYCLEGRLTGKPDTVIHVPADSNASIEIDVNGKEYRYSSGPCPVG